MRQLIIITGSLAVCATAQANFDISSYNTGAGFYGVNTVANIPITDHNWTVSLLSTVPANQTPPGGIPSGPTYLVPTDIGFPFGYWLPNTPASSWITYSTPTQVAGDTTADTFQYEVKFTDPNSVPFTISFASDNASWLYVNQQQVAWRPDNLPYASFDTYTVIPTTANTTYTIDFDVYNTPQDYGNPTGANVQFSAVPEPTTMVAGAMLLLPFGMSALRIMRKSHMA